VKEIGCQLALKKERALAVFGIMNDGSSCPDGMTRFIQRCPLSKENKYGSLFR
jgi:hypothetical protein